MGAKTFHFPLINNLQGVQKFVELMGKLKVSRETDRQRGGDIIMMNEEMRWIWRWERYRGILGILGWI